MKPKQIASRSAGCKARHLLKQVDTVSRVTAAVLAALHGAQALAAGDGEGEGDNALAQVVVTASRRESQAQDLPISITAITGEDLEQAGIADIASLARSMAGISYTDKGPFSGVNGANLIIRGLNSETTSGLPAAASPVVPPVATYVDDTPLFFSVRFQDLDRIEILRGPQGTLYGSGSLGGTVKFVQNAPDPSGFDANAEVGLSSTSHTDSPNGTVNAMLNVPLNDTFAVRINAGYEYQAGFINYPNLYVLDSSGAPVFAQPGNLFSPPVIYGRTHVNSYEYDTGRISLLWKPNDRFRAQLSYYYQRSIANGYPYIATSLAAYNEPISPATQPSGSYTNPPLLPQLYTAPVPPGVDTLSSAENFADTTNDRVDLAALTLEYDFGFATLTSSTSWAHHVNNTLADETNQYINFFFYQSLYGQNPRTWILGREGLDDRPVTQELRLVSKAGAKFDWVTGVFYNDQQTDIQEHDFYHGYLDFYNACQPIYGQSAGDGTTPSYCGIGETAYTPGTPNVIDGIPIIKDQAYIGDFETRFKDLALFGELTWHITPDWSATGGARLFKQTITASQQTGLLFDGPTAMANITHSNEWRKALWKVNMAYQLDKNNLVYATWSQGFRRGSVNALPPVEFAGTPIEYDLPAGLTLLQPDKADNYELGVKGTLANRFRYSAAVFDIEWHNIQEGLQLTPLVLPASMNIGSGYSRGFESEFYVLLASHLTAQLDYTYDNTALHSLNPLYVTPNVVAPPPPLGSPLPGTPRSSFAVSVDYTHPLAGGELDWLTSAHYQSAILPSLSASVPIVGGYTMLDTRLSFARTHWVTSLYVNNLTNKLGVTSYQDPAIYGNRAQAIVSRPRTVGLTLAYSFNEK